jgi:integrase
MTAVTFSTEARMSRKATGTIEACGDHFKARITLKSGKRVWIHLPPGLTEPRARERAAALSERARKEGRVKVDVRSSGTTTPPQVETLRQWCDRWLASRVQKNHANVDTERWNLGKHVYPRLGECAMTAVTSEQIEAIVEDLDRRIAKREIQWKTASNVWGLITKMFSDARSSKVRALRVRADNPAAGVRGPDRGGKRLKQYLYPSEFLTLVGCERIPLADRRLFALAVYLFVRPGELEALAHDDLHLEHGMVSVHRSLDRKKGKLTETKTETPRRNPIEPEILPLLRAMHREADGKGRVAPPMLSKLAPMLRRCLKTAGVTRPDLFTTDATRKQITFYDLRATGITWMAVRGDAPLTIMKRAGHVRFETTDGYIREAENLRGAGFGAPFPPLPPALFGTPESSGESSEGGGSGGSTVGDHRAISGGGAGNRTRVRKASSSPSFTCVAAISPAAEFADSAATYPSQISVALSRAPSRNPALVVDARGVLGRPPLWTALRFLRPRERVHCRSHV